MGFAFHDPKPCEVKDVLSKAPPLEDVEEASGCIFESALPEENPFNKGIKLTVRYLREKDEDRAEGYIRTAMKKRTDSPARTVSDLGCGTFYVSYESSIFVVKPTLRGSTLLQIAIDGAPGEQSLRKGTYLEDLLDKEKKIALKILGPAQHRVASYEARHADEEVRGHN
jgi:hypothetical protein